VRPLPRAVVAGPAAVLAAIPLLGACGPGTDDDSLPPLTPEPSLSVPLTQPSEPGESAPPAARPGRSGTRASYPARLALMKFLRGVGAGDARACGHVAPAYARTAFADHGGCAQWITEVGARLSPEQVEMLRTVLVPGATSGPRPGQYTIRPADLRWRPAAAPAPRSVVAGRYVLARTGSRWLIVA
jgi:hypothetical protein